MLSAEVSTPSQSVLPWGWLLATPPPSRLARRSPWFARAPTPWRSPMRSTGPEGGPAVILLHGFPYDAARLRRGRAAARRRGLPRARAVPARLRPDALPVGRRRRARASRRRWATTCSQFMDALGIAPRGPGRLRLGRPRRLRRRRAVARARARPGELRRLQHPGHRRLGRAGAAEQEHRYWYQYYFHTERGRAGLAAEPPRHLPAAVEAVVAELALRRGDLRAAAPCSFDNPDFVDVVIQSYRHRYGYARRRSGARGHRGRARAAAQRSPCRPSTLHGGHDGVEPGRAARRPARISSPDPTSGECCPRSGTTCRRRRRRRMCARYGSCWGGSPETPQGREWRCCAPSVGDTAKGQMLSLLYKPLTNLSHKPQDGSKIPLPFRISGNSGPHLR